MRILERERPASVVHATASPDALSRVVLWLGGTPHTGRLLEPVVAAARAVERDVVSIARPGFGGAARRVGRSVADGADEAAGILDLLDVDDVVVVGFSGGGPHAIATGARRPRRVRRVATFGCPAPFDGTEGWFVGMADPSALRAATCGLAARTDHPDAFEPSSLVAADREALEGPWGDLALDTQAASEHGALGAIDDDMAFVRSWGIATADCTVPVAIVHGAQDRVVPVQHAHALAATLPDARAVLDPHHGHVSILGLLAAQLRAAER